MAEGTTNTHIGEQTYKDYTIEHMLTNSVETTIADDFVVQLHETLDIYQLLENFNKVFREKVVCDCIEYNDEESKTYFINGKKSKPSCIYTLRYEEQILGTISISRENQFLDYEVENIEVLLAGLTIPMRNALRYKKSLQDTFRDELTGLRNSCQYHDTAALEVRRAQRYKTPFSILLFDIDDLSAINNQYGRAAGDVVLISVAKRLERKVRNSDIVYRNNGSEFLIFLPNTEKEKAIEAAERIKESILIDKCICLDNIIDFTLNVSAETVSYQDTASNLMDRASNTLQNNKKEKNQLGNI